MGEKGDAAGKARLREWALIRRGEWTDPMCQDGETLLMHYQRYIFDEWLREENLFLERHRNGEFVISYGEPGGFFYLARSINRGELEAGLSTDDAIAAVMSKNCSPF